MNSELKVSFKTVWLLIVINIIIGIVGAWAKITQASYADLLLIIGIIFFFTYWIIVLSDIVQNKVYNKNIWYLMMFLIPAVAPIIYLLFRQKLLES